MAKGYSKDLRERVVSIVEEGDSAREAARLLNVGASTAIRWIERWTTTGSVEAKPGTGHSRSPLNKHEQWLLNLIAAEPDLTLDDTGNDGGHPRIARQSPGRPHRLRRHRTVSRAIHRG